MYVRCQTSSTYLDRYTQAFTQQSHGLQTLLVIRTTTTNKDLDLVSDQASFVFLQGTNNALECGSNVGEVSDTATDDENLSIRVRRTSGDQVNDRLGVFVCLAFSWGS